MTTEALSSSLKLSDELNFVGEKARAKHSEQSEGRLVISLKHIITMQLENRE